MSFRFAALVGLIFGLDRLTKIAVSTWLPLNTPRPVFHPYLYFTYIKNKGAAFGILQNQQVLLIVSGLLVLVIFWFYRKELLQYPVGRVGATFLIAGDLGNLFDRVFYGGVIDFIDSRVWPIFNVADMCIDLGIILLLFDFWILKSKKPENVS